MYIGPWQEYKLAKLIQARLEQKDSPSPSLSRALGRRQSSIDRLHNGGSLDGLDSASVASSSRSGLSSNSAPPRLTAQSRLDDLYYSAAYARERPARGGLDGGGGRTPSSSASSAGRPPRPQSSASSGRQARPNLSGRPPPRPGAVRQIKVAGGATANGAVAPKPNPEAERRARIAHMQRLYGLGAAGAAGAEDFGGSEEARPSPGPPPAAALPSGYGAASDALGDVGTRGWLPQVVQPSAQLQASSPSTHRTVTGSGWAPALAAPAPPAQAPSNGIWAPPVSVAPALSFANPDPLGMSLSGGDAEEDLIAWSKMLRPDSMAADADLTSLLQPS